MPIVTPEKYREMLDAARAGHYALPAINTTSSSAIIAALEGKFDFGFAVDWMRKDLSLVLEEARRNGSQLPVTALVDQFYAEVQGMGGQRWDTSSLIKRL